ncbi:MAG: hypothetical protein ABI346_02470, partial [Candidatus Baltobacteraceae bacterium]
MNASFATRLVFATSLLLSLAAPAFGSRTSSNAAHLSPSGSPIQHVIFIVQENRSFNNLFMGYPNALTQNYGYDSSGNR